MKKIPKNPANTIPKWYQQVNIHNLLKLTRVPSTNHFTWLNLRAMNLPGAIETVIKDSLAQFFEGAYAKKTMFQRMFPLAAGVYAVLLFFSWILFPGGFSFNVNSISDLGNPILNPSGFMLFSAAFFYLAFFMIPFYQFIHKRLAPLGKWLAKVGLIANLAGSGGFIALALFPNTIITIAIHVPAAITSFGGLVVGGLVYWTIIVKDAVIKTGTRRIIPLVGALTNVVVGIAVLQIFDITTFLPKDLPESIFAPWEWTMFFAIAANLLMLFRSTPEIERKATIYRLLEEQQFCAPQDAMRIFANHLPDPEDEDAKQELADFSYSI